MAKLPPKPLNPVHEFFPVGADGQSPMNFGAFDQAKKMGLVGEDEDETKWKKGGLTYIDGDAPLNKNGETYSERMKKKIYGKNPIVEDPDNPDQVIRKDDIPSPNNKIGGIGATSPEKKSFNPSDLIKKTKNKTPKVNLEGPMPESVKNLIKKGKNHPTKEKS